MQHYHHKVLTDLDETGFGVKYEHDLTLYTPPHWHKAVELLLFLKGKTSCIFENGTFHAKTGDVYIINSHQVHASKLSRNAVYL